MLIRRVWVDGRDDLCDWWTDAPNSRPQQYNLASLSFEEGGSLFDAASQPLLSLLCPFRLLGEYLPRGHKPADDQAQNEPPRIDAVVAFIGIWLLASTCARR